MTNPDDSYYERVAGRIFKVMLVLAAGGAMVALVDPEKRERQP